jgi:hypothetical protein
VARYRASGEKGRRSTEGGGQIMELRRLSIREKKEGGRTTGRIQLYSLPYGLRK